MRKNYLAILSILLVGGLNIFWAVNSPGNRTGSPGDNGNTCNAGSCHAGTPTVTDGAEITHNIPGTGWVAGTTYQLNLRTISSGAAAFGFELVAENGSGSVVGTLSSSDSRAKDGAAGAMTHNSKIVASDTLEISFDWVAPSAGEGDVTFYAAVNAANNNGSPSGDVINTGSTTVSEDNSAPSSIETLVHSKLVAFPNPAIDRVRLSEMADIRLFDLNGKLILSGEQRDGFDVSSLESGIYLLEMSKDGSSELQRLFVR